MSHEHAKDSRSRTLPMEQSMGRTARERTVQHLAEGDLLPMPPRITHPSSVVGRIESGGLGRPSFAVIDCAGDLIPDALVLEYGPADAEHARSSRVWIRTSGRASTPSYVLSSDSSSGGYVTA